MSADNPLELYKRAASVILHCVQTGRESFHSGTYGALSAAESFVQLAELHPEALRFACSGGRSVTEVGEILEQVQRACGALWEAVGNGEDLFPHVREARRALRRLTDLQTLLAPVPPSAPSPDLMAPPAEPPQLGSKERRVLLYLLKNDPQHRLQLEICAGIDMAKSTVRTVLRYLVKARLVTKIGERGGYGLTAEGRALARKLSLNQ
jgi:DNA-binding MarR family transcriptional regulator